MDTLAHAFDRDHELYGVHDVQLGLPLCPTPLPVVARTPVMGEAAAPDVPAALGWMILAAYGAIMGAFLTLYTGNLRAAMMVAISGAYMAVFFAVPIFFLKQEPARAGRQDPGPKRLRPQSGRGAARPEYVFSCASPRFPVCAGASVIGDD